MFLVSQRYMDCCNLLLHILSLNCAILIDSYTSISESYSHIIFSLLINAVIFGIELSSFNTLSLYTFDIILCTKTFSVSPLLYLMVTKIVSPYCGIRHLQCCFLLFQSVSLFYYLCFCYLCFIISVYRDTHGHWTNIRGNNSLSIYFL